MTIEDILLKIGKGLKIIKLDTVEEQMQALIHVSTSSLWACVFSNLCRHSCWWFLSVLPWVGHVLYKELYVDGHWNWRREDSEKKRDFFSDLFTKLIGLVFYLLTFVR